MPNNLDPDDISKLNEGLRELTEVLAAQTNAFKSGTQSTNNFSTALKSSNKEALNV